MGEKHILRPATLASLFAEAQYLNSNTLQRIELDDLIPKSASYSNLTLQLQHQFLNRKRQDKKQDK